MIVCLQRVTHANVRVDDRTVGSIKDGLLALVGIGAEDDADVVAAIAQKVATLRIFSDQDGKMNLSVQDIGGSVLSVSQFTLLADCRRGRRPAFTAAAPPEIAIKRWQSFNETLSSLGIHVETGRFGADMQVELQNNGPVTIVLDSDKL